VDTARVLELYVPTVPGVGSGYRVGVAAALAAAHVVAGLPDWEPGEPVPGDVDAPGVCRARPLGQAGWVPAVVAWRDEDKDLAVLRLAPAVPPLPAGSPAPRWGRVDGVEPVAVTAVGFPWAQERLNRVRDSEQLFGFVAPATTVKAGQCAVTVLSAAPAERAGGSPWAGMSGAALFAGPFLVGVLIIDPARFGADRVVAVPVAPLLGDAELGRLLGAHADAVVRVGPRFRLAVTSETSVAVTPPYRPPTGRLGREPARLLLPEHGIVPFVGRDSDLEMLGGWCRSGAASALRVVVGAGGSGKTRLAAEACVRMAGQGWQAGFADPKAPGGQALLEFDQPTLLVVDDADLHVALLADLIHTVAYWPAGAPPVRLLLLARHTTGWWETLNQRTDQLAAELADPPVMLHDGSLAPAQRIDHHARALRAFAAHMPDPAMPGGQAPPVLADPVFANPLLVHMHALLSVCEAQVPTTGTAVRERILGAVLDRERERWATTFPTGFPTGGDRTCQQVVTAATLLAPPTETATAQIMTVIGELEPDAAAGARAAVASWLRKLYPGGDPPWVAPLRPDLLAEPLPVGCPQLTELSLAGIPASLYWDSLSSCSPNLSAPALARRSVRHSTSSLPPSCPAY
jgi:Trypsin-like peptidase domain